ncbi:unnamed protein product [Pleuronectes platessa]|uniref:Uncharacterized protein n=1 Tax=Pleuronectes platessa TaxID=8262 RepID=A0A9N7YUT4_PLEPL|nr:unnamed protein product [Pleuronectes platessa]
MHRWRSEQRRRRREEKTGCSVQQNMKGGVGEMMNCSWKKSAGKRFLGVLRELRVFHSERVAAWREALRECVCMLSRSPLGGGDLQDASTSGAGSNSFSDIFQSVSEDFENLTQNLSTIVSKLEAEILRVSAEEASGVDSGASRRPRPRNLSST